MTLSEVIKDGSTDDVIGKMKVSALLEYVGPLVETRVQEKPLSIALRETRERLLKVEQTEA